MKKLFSLIIAFSFILLSVFALAEEKTAAEAVSDSKQGTEAAAKKDTEKKEETKVKFAPKSTRDPFLSKEEVESIEKARRAEIERIEKERRDRENALIAARDAEKARQEREAYLKANPHLAIVNKIKIQGMMGDEVQINNDFKGVGDKVAGATITKITNTKIHFKYKGKDFSLPIPKAKE
jgi:hypothetical protein